MDDEIEYTILDRRDVMAYQVPPATSQGHKADDWKNCIWQGHIHVTAKGKDLVLH